MIGLVSIKAFEAAQADRSDPGLSRLELYQRMIGCVCLTASGLVASTATTTAVAATATTTAVASALVPAG